MKIEQKFSIGKKGFNFNDVRQVIVFMVSFAPAIPSFAGIF